MSKQQDDQREKRIAQALEKVSIVDLLNVLKIDYNSGRKIHCIFPDHQEKTPSMVVYEHTNSVYCFGCGKSGGLIQIVQTCVPTSGRTWSVERALSWLEDEFDLPSPKALDSLSQKIGKTLKQGSAKKAVEKERQSRKAITARIDLLIKESKQGHSKDAAATCVGVEGYIYDELEVPGVDVWSWLTWAQALVKGYYCKQLDAYDDLINSVEFQLIADEIREDFLLMEIAHLDLDEKLG